MLDDIQFGDWIHMSHYVSPEISRQDDSVGLLDYVDLSNKELRQKNW